MPPRQIARHRSRSHARQKNLLDSTETYAPHSTGKVVFDALNSP